LSEREEVRVLGGVGRSVHDEKQGTENGASGNTTGGGTEG